MHLDDFDFDLPKSAIALRPTAPRDAARLLVAIPAAHPELAHHHVSDLPRLLRPGDILVLNDTKVLPAQLEGERPARGGDQDAVKISLTLIERLSSGHWKALSRPAKRLRVGDEVWFRGDDRKSAPLSLLILDKDEDGGVILSASANASVEEVMAFQAIMPLPSYIARTRGFDEKDRTDYQTVYAKMEGAVAAPTAGLHFTADLFEALKQAGIETAFVTLHVGAGTFLPVKSDVIDQHELHAEWCEIGAEAVAQMKQAKQRGGRVVAVGTTSLRVLETAASADGGLEAYRGPTRLFVKPGYEFRVVDVLLTNFHLPKSTLFMLVCAFSGTQFMKKAYAHALEAGFRFYSYGDACLLYKSNKLIGSP